MVKAEDDFMVKAPTGFENIEGFLRQMTYLTAKQHGKTLLCVSGVRKP